MKKLALCIFFFAHCAMAQENDLANLNLEELSKVTVICGMSLVTIRCVLLSHRHGTVHHPV